MDNGRMNYPAVVVAGIVYWLVQATWYTALSAQWMAAIGKTKEQLGQGGDSPVPYIVSLVCDIVLAFAIAWVVSRGSEQSTARGVSAAALLWLGLVVTTMETNYIFERRPATLLAINGGSSLIGMLIMGAIVGGWRKKAKS